MKQIIAWSITALLTIGNLVGLIVILITAIQEPKVIPAFIAATMIFIFWLFAAVGSTAETIEKVISILTKKEEC